MCTLPYPDRFYAAVAFAASPPPTARGVTDETRLLLYALFQQATEGPCMHPKPWGWNVVESAKWTSWKQLATMPLSEAMRLYVRTLEDENPNWWQLVTQDGDPEKVQAIMEAAAAAAAAAVGVEMSGGGGGAGACVGAAGEGMGGGAAATHAGAGSLAALQEAVASVNKWYPAAVHGTAPLPRFEHAAVQAGGRMYVVAGNARGNLLNDVHTLDLSSLTWSRLEGGAAPPESRPAAAAASPLQASGPTVLPYCAGSTLVAYNGRLIALGGYVKGATGKGGVLEAYALDTETAAWIRMEPTGTAPSARGGHTATLIGSKLWVFGGQTPDCRLLNDVNVLDLEAMAWSTPKVAAAGVPAARCRHTACSVADRYLLIFGGGSNNTCLGGLHLLDTVSGTWSEPACEGHMPAGRSGHAGAVLDGCWYLAGGGDCKRALTDTLVLELRAPSEGPMRWLAAVEAPLKSSLISEGQSLVAVPEANMLVAFGGYNERYHNAVHALCPEFGAKRTVPAVQPTAAPPAAPSTEEPSAVHELQLMRRQLASAQAAQAAAEKEAVDLSGQLSAAQTRVFQLEVELAELMKKLEGMRSLEQEVAAMRRTADVEAQKKSAGLWGYIAGSDKAPVVQPAK